MLVYPSPTGSSNEGNLLGMPAKKIFHRVFPWKIFHLSHWPSKQIKHLLLDFLSQTRLQGGEINSRTTWAMKNKGPVGKGEFGWFFAGNPLDNYFFGRNTCSPFFCLGMFFFNLSRYNGERCPQLCRVRWNPWTQSRPGSLFGILTCIWGQILR